MAFSVRRAVAIVSALFIWVAALIEILQYSGAIGGTFERPDWDNSPNATAPSTTERAAALRDLWDFQRDQLKVDIPQGLIFVIGLILLAYTVLCLKKVFKSYEGGRSDIPDLMLLAFVFGALIIAYEFVADLGSEAAVALASRRLVDMTSDEDELVSTSISILASQLVGWGRKLFIFALGVFLLSFGTFLAAILTRRTRIISGKHAVLGFVTTIIGWVTCALEIREISSIYFEFSASYTWAFVAFMAMWGLILMPIWTIWLGFELTKIKESALWREQGQRMQEDGNINNA